MSKSFYENVAFLDAHKHLMPWRTRLAYPFRRWFGLALLNLQVRLRAGMGEG